MNKPHQCYQAGLMGCTAIEEKHLGTRGGVEECSYIVHFENGDSIAVKDPIYVSD